MKILALLCLLASFAANAGPGVIYGQPYPFTPGTSQPYPLTVNSAGQITTTLLAGEDQTNGVMKVEHQYSKCIDDVDIVCKASAGFVHSINCFGTDAAATAGRVRLTNTTAAGGAEGTEVWGAEFAAALVSPQGAILDIVMDTGIVIDFTTTADVKCVVSYR